MQSDFDVLVLGGGLVGSSVGLLLRRERPDLRVAIVERRDGFDRGVGEATVEVSGHFLTHRLRLADHLSREHLPKQGLRFWFTAGGDTAFDAASEIGPFQLARLPAWQIDRSVLDAHVFECAKGAGAEVLRPARIRSVTLLEEGAAEVHQVLCDLGGERRELTARYLVDATGRSAVVARARGWVRSLREEHPTQAVWARFTGVRDLDAPDSLGLPHDHPMFGACVAPRRLATNHLNGYGYWIWAIPLGCGETSVGAVWDARLVSPVGTDPESRLRWFVQHNPVTRHLLEPAVIVPGDVRGLGNLAYLVDRVAGRGWSAVGDAGGFLDPFYSPGLDQGAYSVHATLDLAQRWLDAGATPEHLAEVEAHDVAHRRYLRSLFEGVYKDKYHILGDYDLMSAALLIDTGMYYLTAAEPVYRRGRPGYRKPPFYADRRDIGLRMVKLYRDRLLAIAARRRALGTYGKRNEHRRTMFGGFALGWPARRMLLRGVRFWLRAEAEHFASYLWRPRPAAQSARAVTAS